MKIHSYIWNSIATGERKLRGSVIEAANAVHVCVFVWQCWKSFFFLQIFWRAKQPTQSQVGVIFFTAIAFATIAFDAADASKNNTRNLHFSGSTYECILKEFAQSRNNTFRTFSILVVRNVKRWRSIALQLTLFLISLCGLGKKIEILYLT